MYQSIPYKRLLLQVFLHGLMHSGLAMAWKTTKHRKTSLEHSSELQSGTSGHLKDTSFALRLPCGLGRNGPVLEMEAYCMNVTCLHLC